MKPTIIFFFVCCTLALPINAAPNAQPVLPPPDPTTQPSTNPAIQVDLQAVLATRLPDGSFPATIAERAQDSRRWERLSLETNGTAITIRTNSWQELASGMHYRDPVSGQWVESAPEIVITNSGPYGAMARGAPHRAWFPGNVNSPVSAEVATPDGQHLKTRILGIAYEDFHARTNVLIAELKDSDGDIISTNPVTVLYADSFTDFRADIRLTYTKGGIEQDIILRQRPPLPEQFGLNPTYTRLLLLTEFIDPPTNVVRIQQVRRGWAKAKVDKAITIGGMTIGQGTAFRLGDDNGPHSGIPVQKRWQVLDGRHFLIEEIPFHRLVPLLAGLQASAHPRPQGKSSASLIASAKPPRSLPSLASVNPPFSVLNSQLSTAPGLVLDFNLQNATNMVLQGDTTYVVASNATVNLTSNSVIEGGCIVKFGRGSQINFLGPIQCLTGRYRPAIFTASDDDSVGTAVPASSGTPSGTYANCALSLGVGGDLKYLNVRYAKEAIYCAESDYTLSHCQILFCNVGLHTDHAGFSAYNTLMYRVATNFYGNLWTGRAEHLTSDQASILAFDPDFTYGAWCHGDPSSTLSLVNTLTASITNGYGLDNSGAVARTQVRDFPTGEGVFQTVGAGAHYLVDGSTNRDCGTEEINPALALDLKTQTTYPPVVIAGGFTANTTLEPQAQRDTDSPDLGWHYTPADWVVNNRTLTNTLILTNGVALATYGGSTSSGISISGSGQLLSRASATRLNCIVRYNTVQEQSNTNWSSSSVGASVKITAAAASAQCRFTAWSLPGGTGEHFKSSITGNANSFVDCQFGGGKLTVDPGLAALTNNLFERVFVTIKDEADNDQWYLYNNLFHGGTLSYRALGDYPVLLAYDNLFDGTTITRGSSSEYFTHGYNAYLTNCDRLTPTNAHDVLLTNADYVSGPLGSYYYPTNGGNLSRLLDAGSTNAQMVGLYSYTVTTNFIAGLPARETNSVVDIGFHHVAVDPNCEPLDLDGDGFADYLNPDSNNNGIPDWLEVLLGYDPTQPNDLGTTKPGYQLFLARPKPSSPLP